MTTASDGFNRANETPLASPWANGISSGANLASNLVTGPAGADGVSFYNSGVWANDQSAQGTVGGLSSGTAYAGIAVRWSGTRGYSVVTDGSSGAGHTDFIRWDAGAGTVIGSIATTFANGDVLKLGVVGTTLTCYKNAVSVGSVVDATYANGNPGLHVYNTGTLDDWSADDGAGTVEQEGARFGADDGSESAHTWLAAQDSNVTHPLSSNLLLRMLLNGTLDVANAAYSLRYQKNGAGGYADVPTAVTSLADVTFIGAGAQAVSNTTSASVNAAWPAGYTAVANDVAILVAAGRHGNGTSLAPSDPSGYTQVATRFREIGAVDLQVTVWIKKLTASEASPSVTVPSAYGGGGTTNGLSAQVAVYRNVDTTTAQDVAAVASDSAAAASWAPTGLTTTTAKARVISVVASGDDNALGLLAGSEQGFTPRMSGASYDTTTGSDHAVGLADKEQTAAGAVTMCTWQETAVGNDALAGITLALRPATVTNSLYVAASANIAAGGEATTARLTAPSGKTTADFVTGRRWDDENGSDSIDLTTDDYTEVEWCMQAQSPSVNGDFFDFRVYSGGSAIATYTVTPRWTVGTPAGPTSYPAITSPSVAARLARLLSF